MNIITSSISLRAEPSDNSELETEGLFGEKVTIIKKHSNWLYCKLLTDNYYGWLKDENLDILPKPTHRIISNRSFIFQEKNEKSRCILYLPLGSQLSVNSIEDKWASIKLSKNFIEKSAYVPANHIIDINNKLNDWVYIAERLLGVPYKWGGRDTVGLDCSALLQLSYQTYGQNIPRNTFDQIRLNKKKLSLKELYRGCVIFWKRHVGIMVDKINCIHANAYHMEVVKEDLNNIISRMGTNNQILKIMDFNE